MHHNAVQVGQDFEVGQTKGKEDRPVQVAASVLSRLAVRCEGRSANDLLFPARSGGYLKRPSYDSTGWFNRAVERAEVQTITPHDLRHTCASLAVSSGPNVLAVSRMLGHKDPSVTLRTTPTCSTATSTRWPSVWTQRSQIVSKACPKRPLTVAADAV